RRPSKCACAASTGTPRSASAIRGPASRSRSASGCSSRSTDAWAQPRAQVSGSPWCGRLRAGMAVTPPARAIALRRRLRKGWEQQRSATAAPTRSRVEQQLRAVRKRDLADDREPEAAARSGRAGNAVEALQYPFALDAGNPRAVILDLQDRPRIADPGARRDVPAARRVFERVVREVSVGFAQEEFFSGDLRVAELEAEVDVLRERAAHPFVGGLFGDASQVDARRRIRPATGLDA